MKWMQYFEATRSGDLSNGMTAVGLLVFEIEQIHRLDCLLKNMKRSAFMSFSSHFRFSLVLAFEVMKMFTVKSQVLKCVTNQEINF